MGITNIRFGFLPRAAGGVVQMLGTNVTSGVQPIGPLIRVTSAVGLITCASVIYVSGGNYYVHHANAGFVSQNDFDNALEALGTQAANVSVVYAHNNAQDAGYLQSVNDIIGFGIPAAQMFEIQNITVSQFGISNEGRIGY